MILCLPFGSVTFFCANILILFLTTSIPLRAEYRRSDGDVLCGIVGMSLFHCFIGDVIVSLFFFLGGGVSFAMVWYCVVWCGIVCCGIVWCVMVMSGVVLHGVALYGVVCYGVEWCVMV